MLTKLISISIIVKVDKMMSLRSNYSEVAQLVEHPAVNRQVAGSSPAFGAIVYLWGHTQEAEEAPLLRV